MKVVIVGGNAGGMAVAPRLRRLREDIAITVYERGEYISFANCGLPYYVGEVIKEKGKILVQTPEKVKERFNIDVKIKHEVIGIDRNRKVVKVKNLETGEVFEDGYDYLVLSPGAEPVKPNIPGVDLPHIYTLRTIPDADDIKKEIENGAKSAVVVGAGFIGVEMVENLRKRGLDVVLVEMLDQVLPALDPDIAVYPKQELISKGVKLFLGEKVKEFRKESDKVKVILESGKDILTDFVVLAVGVRPETKLAKEAGLKIGETGGIVVNEKMQTTDPYIFALGDAVEIWDKNFKIKMLVPLAAPATKQARVIANNIAGIEDTYKGTVATSIIKVFDLTCASTGLNMKQLKKYNIPYKAVTIHQNHHAGYYPDAYIIHLKLLYSPVDGKILGAQAVGYEGVDKRIDVLATAISAGLTVYDLQEVDYAYAPQYSSAKDPVNIAAYVAINDLQGLAPTVDVFKAKEMIEKGEVFLLDVRTPEEYSGGTIANAKNIPVDSLRNRLSEIPKDKKILVFCKIGLRGYIAQRILLQNGFDAINISGGYDSFHSLFQETHIPTTTKEKTVDELQNIPSISVNIGKPVMKIDATGLQCPGPILKIKEVLNKIEEGQVIEVEASDPGFYTDIQGFAKTVGLEVLELTKGKTVKATLRKISSVQKEAVIRPPSDSLTIVMFSNNFDKVMAGLIIANGALAMGKKVSMFFTFWGLNVLRKDKKVRVKKNLIEKMFGFMMPRGVKKLVLSKMNMLGIGTSMIKMLMKKHGVEPVEALLDNLVKQGAKLVACTTTMQLMGIKKEELIDGVELGGVATYLSDAQNSSINLFID